MTSRCSTAVAVALFAVAAQADPAPVNPRLDYERSPVHTVVPRYPIDAILDRLQGDVQVCFEITRSGRPFRIAVRRSDHRVFEIPSRNAVRASRYEPLPRTERVPAVKTCRTFRFRLIPADDPDMSVEQRVEETVEVELIE